MLYVNLILIHKDKSVRFVIGIMECENLINSVFNALPGVNTALPIKFVQIVILVISLIHYQKRVFKIAQLAIMKKLEIYCAINVPFIVLHVEK